MIRLDGICKSYGEKSVLNGVSLHVGDGEKVAIMGESGCGKTTLFRIIAGLETPDSGSVCAAPPDGRISYCFAEPRLFENADALGNVTLVFPRGDAKANEKRAKEILTALGMTDFHAYPRELSTGMAQRVSLARAIAYDAPLFLLDEPFRGLDAQMRDEVMAYLLEALREKTVLMITHSEKEAARLAERTLVLSEGMLCEKM